VPKKILVVDDEKIILKVIESRLKSAGYVVVTANDGEEGLAKAKAEQPDLVILDIMMPKMDGTQMREAMRANERTRKIPVIFLTAILNKKEAELTGHKIGEDLILAKPFDGQELLATIKSIVDER